MPKKTLLRRLAIPSAILGIFSISQSMQAADPAPTPQPPQSDVQRIGVPVPTPTVFHEPKQNEWIDPDTGYKVRWMSRVRGVNRVLYFHQNSYTAEGDLYVFSNYTPEQGRRIYTLNLKTLEARKITDRNSDFEIVAKKTREMYYRSENKVCTTNLDTGATREIATIPDNWTSGRGFALNADETMLVGCVAIGEPEVMKAFAGKPKIDYMVAMLEGKLPNILYSIDIKTGKITEILKGNENWYGHVQFSPTDPQLLMYCHEGPWERVDRIWTIRLDKGQPFKAFTRTDPGEVTGHEFWDMNGKTIWTDYTVPIFKLNSIAALDSKTGKMLVKYPLKPWSVHYMISRDGKFFVGDGSHGGDPKAKEERQWIFRYTPNGDGKMMTTEKLCNMLNNDYHPCEPNVSITPDNKWAIFQSTATGTRQVYAVALTK